MGQGSTGGNSSADASSNPSSTSDGIGGVLKGIGSYQKALTEREIAGFNARIAKWQGLDALARGKRLEMLVSRRAADVVGRQRTAYAAQGVALDRGSPASVMADTARLAELDKINVRTNTAKEFYASEVNRAYANWQKNVAKSNEITGLITTVLSFISLV